MLGLLGYLVFGAGYLLITSSAVISGYVLPRSLPNPGYVNDVLAAATNGTVQGDIGLLQTVIKVQGFAWLAGLVFGIALFRARVLARWAAVLLAVGSLVTVLLAVMPDAFYRFLAFPNAIAMIALGYSLWRSAHRHHDAADPGRRAARGHHSGCQMTQHTVCTPDRRRSAGQVPGQVDLARPVALVVLSLIPVISGSLRLVEIAGGPQLMPTNPRIDASPAPVVVHVIGAAVYAILGAFQFSARLRRRHPNWHRKAGRVLVGAGLAVALSGLWMTLFYAGAPAGPAVGHPLVVSSAMGAFLVLGFAAIRRRDIPAHRAWMIRAYALGLGAGTQAFTEGIVEASWAPPT